MSGKLSADSPWRTPKNPEWNGWQLARQRALALTQAGNVESTLLPRT